MFLDGNLLNCAIANLADGSKDEKGFLSQIYAKAKI